MANETMEVPVDTYIYPTYETRFALHMHVSRPGSEEIRTLESAHGFNLRLEPGQFTIGDARGTYRFQASLRELALDALTWYGGRIVTINGKLLLTDESDDTFVEWHPALAKWNWADLPHGHWRPHNNDEVKVVITAANISVQSLKDGKVLASVRRADFIRYRMWGHFERFGFTLGERILGSHRQLIYPFSLITS